MRKGRTPKPSAMKRVEQLEKDFDDLTDRVLDQREEPLKKEIEALKMRADHADDLQSRIGVLHGRLQKVEEHSHEPVPVLSEEDVKEMIVVERHRQWRKAQEQKDEREQKHKLFFGGLTCGMILVAGVYSLLAVLL